MYFFGAPAGRFDGGFFCCAPGCIAEAHQVVAAFRGFAVASSLSLASSSASYAVARIIDCLGYAFETLD
jgi:hypothetical protein